MWIASYLNPQKVTWLIYRRKMPWCGTSNNSKEDTNTPSPHLPQYHVHPNHPNKLFTPHKIPSLRIDLDRCLGIWILHSWAHPKQPPNQWFIIIITNPTISHSIKHILLLKTKTNISRILFQLYHKFGKFPTVCRGYKGSYGSFTCCCWFGCSILWGGGWRRSVNEGVKGWGGNERGCW